MDVVQPVAQTILSFLKSLGKQRGLENLVATVSYHEPFVQHLLAIEDAKQSKPYAWQIRVTAYEKFFEKVKLLFEKRLKESTFCGLTETVNFNFYRYTVQIAFENGLAADIKRLETNEDRSIRFNPLVFVQLLLGCRSREELERIYPDCIVRPSHRHLVDVLFPKLPSYIHTEY